MYRLSDEELEKLKKKLEQNAKIQDSMNRDFVEYLNNVGRAGEAYKKIKILKEDIKKATESIKDSEAEIVMMSKNSGKYSKAEIDKAKRLLAVKKQLVKSSEDELSVLEDINDELINNIKKTNKIAVGWDGIKKASKLAYSTMVKGMGKLNQYGLFDLDKNIKNTSKSLNLGVEANKKFGSTLTSASVITGKIGIKAVDLSNAQKEYSQEIGRSLSLTEDSAIALADIASGTNLGIAGATKLVSEMDKFGLSIEKTRDYIQDSVDLSTTMGVNSDKAISNLENNLRLSQRYNFKNGVKGLTKMANEAAMLKIDMDAMTGMADEVFRPEGAIEMAAKLQVMGGEFAKLGDAQTLMFKARNDFAGFTKDIAKASSEFVSFNENTNEFEVANGLARDRMRELSKITGVGVEKLQEMAVAQKKMSLIKGKVSSTFSDDDKTMIANMATIGKNGELEISIAGEKDPLKVKELTKGNLEAIKQTNLSLSERAKNSQSFDKQLEAFKETFKSKLLPFVTSLSETFGKSLGDFSATLKDNGLYDSIDEFSGAMGKLIGGFGTGFVKTATKIYDVLGPAGILAGLAIFKIAPWIAKGRALGQGFLIATKGFGGAGGSSSPLFGSTKIGSKISGSRVGKGLGKIGRGMRGGVGGLIGAGAGMALDYGRDMLSDENKNGAVGQTMGVASGALAAGGTGAMIGSMFGPIGTAIGGIGGLLYGGITSYMDEKAKEADRKNNGGQSVQKIQDGIIKFHNNDKFTDAGNATVVAGTNVNGNKDLAKAINGGGGSSEMKHTFDSIDININIKSDGSMSSNIGEYLSNDRRFIKNISEKINREVRMAIGGGKLNPNPL